MRVSKTRQHGSYRRVTELHLTQFPVYIISSRGETFGSKPANDHANVRLYILIVSSPQNAFANRRPELFIPSSRTVLADSFHFFLPFLSPLPTRFKRHRGKSRSVFSSGLSLDYPSSFLFIPLHCVSLDLSGGGIRRCNLIYFEKVELHFFFSSSFFLHAYIVVYSRQNF